MLNAYIDETHLEINGRPVLLYGIVVPHNLEEAVEALAEAKARHGLARNLEVKWALRDGTPEKKAAIKSDVLHVLSQQFLCFISLTSGANKDNAFVNALRQVRSYMIGSGYIYLNVFHDEDCFQSRKLIRAELDSWSDVQCTSLASMDSSYSVPIQFADILAGTFRYIIRASFGATARTVTLVEEGYDEPVVLPLDALFRLALRYSIWGSMADTYTEEEESVSAGIDAMFAHCFGTGVVATGVFSDQERSVLREVSTFYRGCIH
jgi:hypothetical protein